MSILNQDCLEHIFQFLEPKSWVAFSQVCELWKLAATSKDSYKLRYYKLVWSKRGDCERMSFEEFFEIIKLIAPKLKYARIQRRKYETECNCDVWVTLGRFDYIISVNEKQDDILMNILATRAKSIKTLKTDCFSGATKKQWKFFFQVNRLTCFIFYDYDNFEIDRKSFFQYYISLLPNTLEQVGIVNETLSGEWNVKEQTKLVQVRTFVTTKLFQKQHRLLKLKLTNVSLNIAQSCIAPVLTKHAKSITELTLDFVIYEDLPILREISNCTNLTKLKLRDSTLGDANSCKKIAQNCQSLRYLDLEHSLIPEKNLETLMSLPNLEKLKIGPIKMTFTKEVKSIKKLIIFDQAKYHEIDFDYLARALSLMPSLTSLTLAVDYLELTGTFARSIKQIIHSRGQNIVLYKEDYYREFKISILEKEAQILCPMPSSNNFPIFCRLWSYQFDELVEMFTDV